VRIDLKPLSVNRLYRGGPRYRTAEYNRYKRDLTLLLPRGKAPAERFGLIVTFGVSNKRSDLDNLMKGFLDVLQDVYMFNDRQVYYIGMKKRDVKRGEEFIDFEFMEIGGE
jgi:Holliday junction resolvase RusA-like endonuclease